jgi:UDP-glucose 4-epimerase
LRPSELPKGSPTRRAPDISKLRALGYEPTVSLDAALGRTLAWYREAVTA